MIFRLPYSWLKDYVALPASPQKLASELSIYGPSVERVLSLRHEFEGVVVGIIKRIIPHPNADKLQIAFVNIGKKNDLRIVCGAPNIKVGQRVPTALPGAKLPGGLLVQKRVVRGVMSEGMLCSARELGIHDDHLGILILHNAEPLGRPLERLGLAQDFLLEVEPTTNRPDLASVIGVAREVSAITKKPLRYREPKLPKARLKSPVGVTVNDRRGCLKFMAVYVKDVSVTSSPWWMQERLARAGIRPINSVVDITNYVMLEYGQPMHAYDADKLRGKLIVRPARQGEKLLALDGRVYDLAKNHLIVADSKRVVGIAGIMGGEDTGVTLDTTNVLFEAASWEPVTIRRTSRELQLSSEASKLFEKGLSTELPMRAIARALELTQKIAHPKALSRVISIPERHYEPKRISFSLLELKRMLGITIPPLVAKQILERLGFLVSRRGSLFIITVPYWRDHDVSEPHDIVEEVARLYGYHNFPSVVPPPTLIFKDQDNTFLVENNTRRKLKSFGFTEAYSYSFISEQWLKALNYPLKRALKVANPLTSDLVYMRPSLMSSLASTVAQNIAHHETLKIFEIAKIYLPGGKGHENLEAYREENMHVSGVLVDPTQSAENLFRLIKGTVESLVGKNYAELLYGGKAPIPFAPGLSLGLISYHGRLPVGGVGIIDPQFMSHFGATPLVAAFDLPLSLFNKKMQHGFLPIPKFPAVKRDASLAVSFNVNYNELIAAMRASSALLKDIELFDIYHGPLEAKHSAPKATQGGALPTNAMSLAMHLTYRADDRTLTAEEVDKVHNALLAMLINRFKAVIRSS